MQNRVCEVRTRNFDRCMRKLCPLSVSLSSADSSSTGIARGTATCLNPARKHVPGVRDLKGSGTSHRAGATELAVLVGLAILTTILFASSSIDIAALRAFYRPEALDHWPLANEMPWSAIYRLASIITVALVAIGLAA